MQIHYREVQKDWKIRSPNQIGCEVSCSVTLYVFLLMENFDHIWHSNRFFSFCRTHNPQTKQNLALLNERPFLFEFWSDRYICPIWTKVCYLIWCAHWILAFFLVQEPETDIGENAVPSNHSSKDGEVVPYVDIIHAQNPDLVLSCGYGTHSSLLFCIRACEDQPYY